jgi:putative DNA primase/helicase
MSLTAAKWIIATEDELAKCCYTKKIKVKSKSGDKTYEIDRGVISATKTAEVLTDRFHFINLKNDGTLYAYVDGCYKDDGLQIMNEYLTRNFKHIENDKGNPEMSKYKRDSIKEMLTTCNYIEEFQWDSNPRIINLHNGLYDIDTMKLTPHSHEHLSRIQLPIDYDPNAECPAWDEFLSKVINKNDIEKILEWIGYCTYYGLPIQKALILFGPGGTYKSILLDGIRSVLGEHNCASEPIQSLETRRFASYELIGKLANIVGDLPPIRMASTAIFKSLTSGMDTITVEKKFHQPFQAVIPAKQIFSANELPIVSDRSTGFFRRLDMVQMLYTDDGVKDLIPQLSTTMELQGLFNLAISKLPALLERRRFTNETDIKTMRELYEARSDTVAAFIDTCVRPAVGAFTTKEEMYAEYVAFCRLNSTEPLKYDPFCKRYKETSEYHVEEKRMCHKGRKMGWLDVKVIKAKLLV